MATKKKKKELTIDNLMQALSLLLKKLDVRPAASGGFQVIPVAVSCRDAFFSRQTPVFTEAPSLKSSTDGEDLALTVICDNDTGHPGVWLWDEADGMLHADWADADRFIDKEDGLQWKPGMFYRSESLDMYYCDNFNVNPVGQSLSVESLKGDMERVSKSVDQLLTSEPVVITEFPAWIYYGSDVRSGSISKETVTKIKEAIKNNKRIIIYGQASGFSYSWNVVMAEDEGGFYYLTLGLFGSSAYTIEVNETDLKYTITEKRIASIDSQSSMNTDNKVYAVVNGQYEDIAPAGYDVVYQAQATAQSLALKALETGVLDLRGADEDMVREIMDILGEERFNEMAAAMKRTLELKPQLTMEQRLEKAKADYDAKKAERMEQADSIDVEPLKEDKI